MTVAGRARRLWTRLDEGGLVLVVALLMLAVQIAWRATTTADSTFWQDDFRYLADARELGLSADFLLQDYNGHVMPGQFLLVWAVSHLEFSFTAPAVMLIVFQLLASGLMLWVLWSLWPRRPELLVGYALFLFSPLGLVADTWWAAGLQALPMQCAMLLAVGATVKDHRSPSWRWKATAVAAVVVGLAFWEKALLIVPLLVLVQILLLEDARWADRWAVLRRHRVEWAVWGVLALAYTAVYVLIVGQGERAAGARPSYQDFVVNAVMKTLLPGILGGPWSDAGGENTVYPVPTDVALAVATLVFVVFAGWAWGRQPRAATRAGVLVVAYLVMDLGLVLLGRSEFALLLARDPRYVTDALPVVALGVVAAVAPPISRPAPEERWSPEAPLVRICLLACAALVTSSWVSVQALTDQLSHDYADEYVTRLLREHKAEPDAVIVDASAPPVGVVAQPVSVVFAAAGVAPRFDQPSSDLRMADGFGYLTPVEVPDAEFRETGPESDCGWPVSSLRETRVGTESGPAGTRRVVQLGYFSQDDTALLVELAPSDEPQYVNAPAGLGYLSLVTEAEVSGVAFIRPAGAARLCVTDVTIGAPWPAD